MQNRLRSCRIGPLAITAVLAAAPAAQAVDVVLVPAKDNTLFEEPNGVLSNGSGQHLFSGRSSLTTNNARRAVLAFDVAGTVPAGSTITAVTLTLHMSMAPFGGAPQSFSLRRLLADWGEAGSDAAFNEGAGAAAAAGDATWLHTFFDTQFWASSGGDFSSTVSASQTVTSAIGFFTWGPTQQMRDDVQGWLDDPSTDFGWLLLGNETQLQTARRFDSRNHPDPTLQPMLLVSYAGSSAPAGRIGGPLIAGRAANGQLTLSWGASCLPSDTDYAIYEGTLAAVFDTHLPRACSTGGATTSIFTPPVNSVYYLVVPSNATREGSYGFDGSGLQRGASSAACLAQDTGVCP